MSKPLYSERLSFGITPEMARYLEDLARSRSRAGKPTSKADLLREAVRLYLDQQADLTGSRKQIARSLEGKLDELTRQTSTLHSAVAALLKQYAAHKQELEQLQQSLDPLVKWVHQRQQGQR